MHNFAVDSDVESGLQVAPVMGQAGPLGLRVSALVKIAGDLCSAYDELTTIGFEAFAGDVLYILTAIDGQIAVLEGARDELVGSD